jgi:phosphocarrier protein
MPHDQQRDEQSKLPDAAAGDEAMRIVTIVNQRGLHARAAAKFVKLADQFAAEVTVVKGDTAVSGRSIMGLMMLAAAPGTEIELRAKGADAAEALAAIADLVERKFDED